MMLLHWPWVHSSLTSFSAISSVVGLLLVLCLAGPCHVFAHAGVLERGEHSWWNCDAVLTSHEAQRVSHQGCWDTRHTSLQLFFEGCSTNPFQAFTRMGWKTIIK